MLLALPSRAEDAGGGPQPPTSKSNPFGVLDTSPMTGRERAGPVPQLVDKPLPRPEDELNPETPSDTQTGTVSPPGPATAPPSAELSKPQSTAAPAIGPPPDVPERAAAPTETEPPASKKPVEPPILPQEAQRLREKARQAIEVGSIAAARSLLDGLANRRDPEATFLLGQTYDPRMLSRWGAVGIEGDPGRAAAFYRQAAQDGYVPAPDAAASKGLHP